MQDTKNGIDRIRVRRLAHAPMPLLPVPLRAKVSAAEVPHAVAHLYAHVLVRGHCSGRCDQIHVELELRRPRGTYESRITGGQHFAERWVNSAQEYGQATDFDRDLMGSDHTEIHRMCRQVAISPSGGFVIGGK